MAEICCGVVTSDNEKASVAPCEPSSTRVARRKRMEIRRFKFGSNSVIESPPQVEVEVEEKQNKRQRVGTPPQSQGSGDENFVDDESNTNSNESLVLNTSKLVDLDGCPNYGITSVIGRRRDMEDAVAVHPSFCKSDFQILSNFHYFGVYDGHGCSHVAVLCKDRLHQLVKEELENKEVSSGWKQVMERSFYRMDKEVIDQGNNVVIDQGNNVASGAIVVEAPKCRCELQTHAGSTAVVSIVTPEKIVIANCGDSRVVLSRGEKAIPLSIDHKPDRPDELKRIQDAGGRVIFWDGPRVLGGMGALAMSRAIGDGYLKPYVTSEPEVTETERTDQDECLILASDGLWDVISNEMACSIARMCLNGKGKVIGGGGGGGGGGGSSVSGGYGESSDKACSDAAVLLTKLALARNSSDNISVVVVDLRRKTSL